MTTTRPTARITLTSNDSWVSPNALDAPRCSRSHLLSLSKFQPLTTSPQPTPISDKRLLCHRPRAVPSEFAQRGLQVHSHIALVGSAGFPAAEARAQVHIYHTLRVYQSRRVRDA